MSKLNEYLAKTKDKKKDGPELQCPSCTYKGKMLKENPLQYKCPKCHTLFGGVKS